MSETAIAPGYVPAEVLERLVADLTVDDVRRARAAYPEGDPMRGFAAVYHAAVRTGAVDQDEGEDSFLARVRVRDLSRLLADATDSLPNAPTSTGTSPPSAATGE